MSQRRFEHPAVFWPGMAIVTVGIILQLPMFYLARTNHYWLAGMPVPPEMYLGMALTVAGTLLAAYGLYPARLDLRRERSRITIRALDSAPLGRSHVVLLLVLTMAIVIDVMKPTTLAFVAPGAELEYHLRGPLLPHARGLPIALYPLSGITGTVLGSFLWGWLGDRVGRRAAILLAAVIFISSSTCGAMPAYWLNLICCLVMGVGAGGMLPIAFTLMCETIPARHRGWLMVLVGGGGASLAYVITSWLASTIGSPAHFGWRIMWLIGVPTGLVLLALNRWIPESPRFLLQHGRDDEARCVMARYGASIISEDAPLDAASQVGDRSGQLFRPPFLMLSVCVFLLGIGIGLTQYGFQQWTPSNLEKLGYTAVNATTILRNSSLYGLPLSLPIACLYGLWSSRKTVIMLFGINMAAMGGFIAGGNRLVHDRGLLEVLLTVPTWSISLLASVLAVYAVEIYPTKIRSRGSGLAAGATKFGGVLILALAATVIAAPSIRLTALIALVPMAVAVVVLATSGPETRRRSLEQVTTEETAALVPAAALQRR